MTIKHLLGVCALAASMALAAAGSASALIYEQIYKGTVSPNSIAMGGLFGGISGGEAFTLRFLTDTSRGSGIVDLPNGQWVHGGSNSGTTAPVSAFITVNGHSYSSVDDVRASNSAITSIAGGLNLNNVILYGNGPDYADLVSSAAVAYPGAPAALGQPYDTSSFVAYSPVVTFAGSLDGHGFYLFMDTTSAYARVISAVPEPGTWALMIAGFGLAGATLRRRQVTPA